MTERLLRALAPLVMLVASAGCDAPATPTGPPRCEPQEELGVERRLKEGFRALAEGDRDAAAATFELLLGDEPGHPEALLGLRMTTRGDQVVRPRPRATAPAPKGHLLIAGQAVPVDFEVHGERYRFEERKAMLEMAKDKGLVPEQPPIPHWYRARTDAAGRRVDPNDRAAVVDDIDLVVLHDTHTLTAREAFVYLGTTSGSTHFYIDWDGTIFQTLDLGWEANHVAMTRIDRRSIAIDLVNPVDITSQPPLPAEAAEAGVTRPLSEFLHVQGEETQKWGYTEAQMTSLVRLVRALVELCPKVPAQVPRTLDGSGTSVPRRSLGDDSEPVGVVGHLHLFSRATDPGPGFDWEGFGDAIR
ncbi:MAG: N-acetylmuramoyl-L-alanine amidase [Deltaproteobacteria bacterium]|nr:MAG: N-acetylmuramoyl-L-alanine amidase [Deltaproteobacteria bacterium]